VANLNNFCPPLSMFSIPDLAKIAEVPYRFNPKGNACLDASASGNVSDASMLIFFIWFCSFSVFCFFVKQFIRNCSYRILTNLFLRHTLDLRKLGKSRYGVCVTSHSYGLFKSCFRLKNFGQCG